MEGITGDEGVKNAVGRLGETLDQVSMWTSLFEGG